MATVKVAVFGGNGAFGKYITEALKKDAKVDLTVFTRPESTTPPPEGVKVAKVDLNSEEGLISALKGFDVVVSAAGMAGIESQKPLADAAVKAGVKRILTSEYGMDVEHPMAARVPLLAGKLAVREHVKKLAAEGKITYTFINVGFGLEFAFYSGISGIDTKNHTVRLVNGGVDKIAWTTLTNIGESVAGVVSHLDKTANRAVYIQDAALSLLDVVAILEKAQGTKYTVLSDTPPDELYETGQKALSTGDITTAFVSFLFSAALRPNGASKFDHVDNTALGLPVQDTTKAILSTLQ